ncbi:MAG: TerB family tellurite resistance protein [Crocinitomicaceae bacterium]
MGSIAKRFETGEQAAQKGHFKNLILLARIDGEINSSEKKLLHTIARRLSLTDAEVKEILEDETNYPMMPPLSREDRYERFIQFVEMIVADGEIHSQEDKMIRAFGIALGFTPERLNEKYPIILTKLNQEIAREVILESIL